MGEVSYNSIGTDGFEIKSEPELGFIVVCPRLARPICSIFNVSVAQGTLPPLWKCADVIPVPIAKVAKPKSVDSDLRPISLTPVLSKVLECFLLFWLLP